jgi:hypothetical protein
LIVSLFQTIKRKLDPCIPWNEGSSLFSFNVALENCKDKDYPRVWRKI